MRGKGSVEEEQEQQAKACSWMVSKSWLMTQEASWHVNWPSTPELVRMVLLEYLDWPSVSPTSLEASPLDDQVDPSTRDATRDIGVREG